MTLTVYPAERVAIAAPTFVPQAPREVVGGPIGIKSSSRLVARLESAWVVGHGGAVVGHDRRLLWDLSYEWPGRPHRHSIYGLDSSHAEKLAGTTATIAAMSADSNYFHFLLNSVARIAYLRRADVLGIPDRLLVSGVVTPFVTETLDLFGIPVQMVIGTAENPALQAERLIAPALVDHPFVVAAHVCEFLRTAVFAALSPPATRFRRRRIFIDRSDAPTRRIRNVDALRPALATADIELVRLSGLSVAQQAALFRDTELVVGNHGAALANLVFCAPGTRVLQILAPGMMEREYRTISQHGRLHHDYVVADFATDEDSALPRKHRDLTLDPVIFRRLLASEGWL